MVMDKVGKYGIAASEREKESRTGSWRRRGDGHAHAGSTPTTPNCIAEGFHTDASKRLASFGSALWRAASAKVVARLAPPAWQDASIAVVRLCSPPRLRVFLRTQAKIGGPSQITIPVSEADLRRDCHRQPWQPL